MRHSLFSWWERDHELRMGFSFLLDKSSLSQGLPTLGCKIMKVDGFFILPALTVFKLGWDLK